MHLEDFPLKELGLFKAVKGIGWFIEEYGVAQISYNLTNINISPLHEVFDKTCERAIARGMRVTGSELVGLVPKKVLIDAGKYFLKALKVKSKLISEVNNAFEKFDFLISPTAPVQPFQFGEKIDDPVTLMLLDYNTVTANLTGKPAISVPYRVVNGLPIGMQIMGNSLKEESLLQAAYALESKTELPEVPL